LGLVISLIVKIIKVGFKNALKSLIWVVVLGLVFGGFYLAYRSYQYDQIAEKTAFIQDKVAEISAAKLLGDTFMKEGGLTVGGITLQNINDAAAGEKTKLNEVSYPAELKNYVDSVSAWADKIAVARDSASWGALSDEPDKFEILISDSWIKGLFGNTLEDLAAIKDLGADALKNQDRDKLRFVAARLTTLDHFYKSIETYQSVSLGVMRTAYAATRSGAVIRTRSICFPTGGGKSICIAAAKNSVGKARLISQRNYTVGPAAPETTTGDWNGAFSPIGDQLTSLGGVGITPGQPSTGPQLPPRVDNFYNSCKARGGQIPASLVKTRLPTTEGGYNCQIGGCWEFMTYSGRNYAGGNPGCPEQGLVPKAPVIPTPNPTPNPNPTPTPTPIPKPTSYDGTYSVRYSYGDCGTNIQGVDLGNIGVFDDSLTVKNNVVSWSTGESAKINSSGRAVWSMNLSGMGDLQQVFNFTSNGVSGTFTFQVNSGGYSVGCNGSFTGSKL
jgi:hypothetical protein